MYVIDVVPLTFIPRNQTQILSYFYNLALEVGTVVEIDFNRRKINAIVVNVDTVRNRKLNFKKGVNFELKNISRVLNSELQVGDWQLKIAAYLSNYCYAPLGLSLKTVLPPFFMKRGYNFKIQELKYISKRKNELKNNSRFISADLKNHHLDYGEEIEKQIFNGKQVFLMVAENTAAKYFLEKYAFLNPEFVSSNLNNKKIYELWQNVQTGKFKLIIGTRIGLFLPFQNLGLIIVDDESNEAYKSDMTPRYHGADLAQEIARIHGAITINGAVVPRLDNYHIDKSEIIYDKIKTSLVINVIDEIKAGNFSIFSRDLKDSLIDSYNNSANVILYIPRRGHANFILCQNCNQPVLCPNCNVSLVLHQIHTPILICHYCNYSQPKSKQCSYCKSYSLKPYGIGIEKVEDEIKKFFKFQNLDLPKLFRLDSGSVKTEAEETKIIDDFIKTKGSIILTTQIIFSYKYLIKSDVIGIINADTLMNIPDFRAEELLFRDLITLNSMADRVIIQTHNPEQVAIKLAASGKIKSFFESELKNRKEFSYPPFSKLTKLTYHHRDQLKVRKEAEILAEKLRNSIRYETGLKEFEIIGPNPAFISKERGQYIWNIILKHKINFQDQDIELNDTKIKTRNYLLRVVPAGWIIDVNPRNIL